VKGYTTKFIIDFNINGEKYITKNCLMSKYKVEIEVDTENFQEIFNNIPQDLFAENKLVDEIYEKEVICDVLTDCLYQQIDKDLRDKGSEIYKFMEHHNKCSIEVAKQIPKNIKINKIND
jgi:hypothetical protein